MRWIIRLLKEKDELKSIPIMVLTTLNKRSDVVRAIMLGANSQMPPSVDTLFGH